MKLFGESEGHVFGSETSVNGCPQKHEAWKKGLVVWWHLDVLFLPTGGMCIHYYFFETDRAPWPGRRKVQAKPETKFEEKSIQHWNSVTATGVKIASATQRFIWHYLSGYRWFISRDWKIVLDYYLYFCGTQKFSFKVLVSHCSLGSIIIKGGPCRDLLIA